MNTKTKLATVIETVVQDLARAADEDSVIDQWGLSVAEIEEDLTPEQLQQSQDWLDALVAGARLKFTEDDVTYYYEGGKYYSVYGDDAAYDGSNAIGEPEEISPEMMAVVLLGIHLDAGTLHVVGESSGGAMLPNGTKVKIKQGNTRQGEIGEIQGEDDSDPEAGTEWARYNIVFPDGGRNYKKKHQFDVVGSAVGESAVTSLRFKPDQYNEVPVGAVVTVPEKPGFELQAELQPDLDSDDPENYFTLDLYRFDKKANSKQSLDSLGGIDGRDADYVNQLLQTMLDEQGLVESGGNMTEREMLDALSKYVKQTLKLSVMDPDYTKNTMFSAQWKVVGNTYYYQLPGRSGKIIAVMNKTKGQYDFNPDGLPKPSFESSHLLGEAKDGEEIAQRNKDRDGQPVLSPDGQPIAKSVVFAGGYGGAYNYGGRVTVYRIDAITGEFAEIEIGEDALMYLSQIA